MTGLPIKKNITQLVRFCVIGAINTLGDFALFNVLFVVLHAPIFVANVVAVTVMMGLSLQLNRKFVFTSSSRSYASHLVRFFVVTLAGLHIIQNVILFAALGVVQSVDFRGFLANDVLQVNIAKLLGVAGSAVWDFMLYKFFVFNTVSNSSAVDTAQTIPEDDGKLL